MRDFSVGARESERDMRRWILGLFAMSLAFIANDVRAHDPVLIGTGSETGVYYATGKILCHLLRSKDIPCEVRPSGGSIANLKTLAKGEITFAMVQSDWQFHAYRGSSKWDGEKFDDLRAIFSVYAEPFHIVVKREPQVSKWRDLKGKRINAGSPASGSRHTLEELVPTTKWQGMFSEVHELPSGEQVDAFCDNKIDAFVHTIGVPNLDMFRAVSECEGKIIGPTNTMMRKLVTAARPYYSRVIIQGGTYWSGQPAVDTFGVLATLVARADASSKNVDALVNLVFEQFDGFRASHPAFGLSLPDEMVKEGLSAPLHPAAEAYYQAKGMLD